MRVARGFTLIEMGVAAVVFALLTLPALKALQQKTAQQHVRDTKTNISAIQSALRKFQYENGYYPCPAPLELPLGHADFGKGNCDLTPPAGKIFGLRGTPPALPTPPIACPPCDVVLGTVPVRDLKLPDEITVDGWGSHIIYAVTRNLAASTGDPATDKQVYSENMDPTRVDPVTGVPAPKNNAAIIVKAINGNRVMTSATITTRAPFFLISPGKDRNGAYTIDGGQTACTPGAFDSANCRFKLAFPGWAMSWNVGMPTLGSATFTYGPLTASDVRPATNPSQNQCSPPMQIGMCHYDDIAAYFGNGTSCAVGQVIADVNSDGSYICQNALVTSDMSRTLDPNGTSGPVGGPAILTALTCPRGQVISGLRKDGKPFCTASQIQNGVTKIATVGTNCGTATTPEGTLAADPVNGELVVCQDDTLGATLEAAPCDGAFNVGALSYDKAGLAYICRDDP